MATHHLFIVPVGDRAAVNARAKESFDKTGGEHTVRVPLYASGSGDDNSPVAYWFCIANGAVRGSTDDLLDLSTRFIKSKHFGVDLDKDAAEPVSILARLALRTGRTKDAAPKATTRPK